MVQTIREVLAQAVLYSDDYRYRFIKLPANAIMAAAGVVAAAANPFTALIVDKDEVTLMLDESDYQDYQQRLIEHQVSAISYRLITFDVELEPTLVGFMAHISSALAQAKISILPYAAYSRDHLFVAEADFEKAMSILRQLQPTN